MGEVYSTNIIMHVGFLEHGVPLLQDLQSNKQVGNYYLL